MSIALLGIVTCTSAVQTAASGPADVQFEVAHLLTYLGKSGCAFYRNGTWHDARKAQAHLESKWQWMLQRNLVTSAEVFVNRAASVSSVSGKKYLVRCGNESSVPSSQWFMTELERYRAASERPATP